MTRLPWRLSALLLIGPTLLVAALAAATPLPDELREGAAAAPVFKVTDAGGRTLREVRAKDGALQAWLPLGDMGPRALHAVLAAEDRRFYEHPGIDLVSIVRAAFEDLARRRLVAGGSTVTMQLARILRPHPRTLRGKLGEVALALRIEWSLGKDRILEEYLNRASFGPNLRGLPAASLALFDKSPASLSLAEAALVAGLARGPSLYDLGKRPELARRRRDRVLGRMERAGWASPEEVARAMAEPVVPQGRRPGYGAPHFVHAVASGALGDVQPGLSAALAGAVVIQTTVESDLQRAVEAEVARTVSDERLHGVTSAAAVVLDNRTRDVLSYVGSPDYFDAEALGQNDAARARRQPGSTLKPFLYELAMEKLGFDPSTRLPDVELHAEAEGKDYAPLDYDGQFRGPVRLREALGSSLNVPAVWTALEIGPDAFLTRLRDLGFASLERDARYYGPALALGDGDVTLLELARAYAALAERGVDRPLRFVSLVRRAAGDTVALDPAPGRRVMPGRVADLVVDVLKDHDARKGSFGDRTVLDFPFDAAAKTGTSKGYRDNWAVGFTSEVTAAVWVGNMSGEPMTGVSGITGAGPLLHAVLMAAMLGKAPRPLPISAEGEHPGLVRVTVCALSGESAGPDCPHRVSEWRPDDSPADGVCTMHERVRIDRATGLRAGPACAEGEVEERVFERFPPELRAWAAAAGRPTAPAEFSPRCPGAPDAAAADAVVGIAYPPPGARYVIDPDRPREAQVLDVGIVAPLSAKQAVLFVDGAEVARVGPPFQARWPLAPGTHELVAEAMGQRSARVRVHVRDGG